MAAIPRHLWWDLALAGLMALLSLPGIDPAAAARSTPPLGYLLGIGAALTLAVWRLWPSATFVVAGAAWVAHLALDYRTGTVELTLALAIYGLCARSEPRRALAAMSVLFGAAVTSFSLSGFSMGASDTRGWPELLTAVVLLSLPGALGIVIRTRRDAAAALRTEQLRRAVSEERLRLAREVHDVAGHGLAVIAMQAGVGLRVLDRDPAGVRPVLEAIRAASAEALGELRAEIGVLRGTDGAARPLRPQTGLHDLDTLVERMRGGGLSVSVETAVDVDDLPDELDHAAYRIVQESLTNVLRHAGPHVAATVRVTRRDGLLEVEVSDDGRRVGGKPADDGAGIDGMRRRAHALGGTLTAGPVEPDGFRVRASLPLPNPGPES